MNTFCTRLCENETNLKVIQTVMGHKDIPVPHAKTLARNRTAILKDPEMHLDGAKGTKTESDVRTDQSNPDNEELRQ